MKVIRVAMVCNKSARSVNPASTRKTHYHFFMDALPRHPHLDVRFIGHYANRLDVSMIAREYDVVLLPRVDDPTQVMALKGIRDESVPVIGWATDPHAFLKHNMLKMYTDLKIDWSFSFFPPAAFYKYYPRHIKYTQIPYGVEPKLYETVRPWEERVDDYLAISGILEESRDLPQRLYDRLYRRRPAALRPNHHYKLRTRCSKLPYVIHTKSIYPNQDTDQLPDVLSSFRAAIAATTTFSTIKYIETPAAGCLTFMEVTDQNQAITLGYKDGKTAVFINEYNYQDRFQEYLDDPNDVKWRRIADTGRTYTMNNLTNDTAADKLYCLMRTILGES